MTTQNTQQKESGVKNLDMKNIKKHYVIGFQKIKLNQFYFMFIRHSVNNYVISVYVVKKLLKIILRLKIIYTTIYPKNLIY